MARERLEIFGIADSSDRTRITPMRRRGDTGGRPEIPLPSLYCGLESTDLCRRAKAAPGGHRLRSRPLLQRQWL